MHIKPYLTVILFFCFFDLTAQKGSLSIVVDKDTMYENEVVKVELLLENTQGSYSPPTFEGFRIVGGPNTSSSFTMINGVVSQKKSYTYLLLPEWTGDITIGTASLQTETEEIKTAPVKIFVLKGSGRSEKSSFNKRFKSDQLPESDTTGKSNTKKRVLKKI
ncbi:MAG: BatD family protein [Saprospiraceae bacterium]|jgi:hypothetical protein|nr:BatD family protein [Saprospiraceae bacterium]MBK9564861.1 BatD family protein [Saprospiraceae bacterium]MBP6445200.1 BatD family protein [Saprospiraceae bacterium]